MIQIMKASAGSGKTFNLARNYISVLLNSSERYAYRGILAVTFTNKATAEMKSRILKELRILATDPHESDYHDDFVPSVFPSTEGLRKKAEGILVDILHDYGAFAVSTIDRFFQQTLKAFSREIGQFASYQIELDKNSLIREAVDRILDSLTDEDRRLLGWLNDSVMDQIEKDGKFNLESSLYDMASKLSSEEHETLREKLGLKDEEAYSKDNLEKIRKDCRAVIKEFEDDVRGAAKAALDVIAAAGLEPEDFNGRFLKALRTYADPAKPVDKCPTDSFITKAGDSGIWFAKAKTPAMLPLVKGRLEEPLDRFCSLFDVRYKAYNTAKLLSGQLYGLGLAEELYREFNALLKEKNVLSIDDTNTILRKIIDGSDAPFVYEKLGVRYTNFLLDEFQDTSTVQWLNFLPLLQESDASGCDNLIVGDVKQSIYRWRGSEWSLLDSGVSGAFPRAELKSLKENWRSSRAVVDFNNRFFDYSASVLDPRCAGAGFSLSSIYADVAQIPRSKEPQQGSVKVSFVAEEDELAAVYDSISEARGNGARWGDIAVLVRNNLEGGKVASHLISSGVPVLSDDSLDVKSSVTVRRLVALLGSIESPDDPVNSFLVSEFDVKVPESSHSLTDLCESLLRSLKQSDKATFEGEILYIQSFMDALQEWSVRNGNNLSHFLQYWADATLRVSSPSDSDAVRILTIHKSKGLEFPHVIFPFAEKVQLSGKSCRWCLPAAEGTGLERLSSCIYPVDMTKGVKDTLFEDDYLHELRLQTVDAVNTFYVALTRAEKSLHVISCTPAQKCVDAVRTGSAYEFTDFSQILYSFVKADEYVSGESYDFNAMRRKSVEEVTPVESGYPSYPLNPVIYETDGDGESVPVGEMGRLKFSADSADFFGEDGSVGTAASVRLNGVVLHGILSCIDGPDDLDRAVAGALDAGDVSAEDAGTMLEYLRSRICGASARAWFGLDPDVRIDSVWNERPVVDVDGSVYRPDRVVVTQDGVIVIDFKFGEERKSHFRQVARYVDIYRRMGYSSAKGFIWYVPEDRVVEV